MTSPAQATASRLEPGRQYGHSFRGRAVSSEAGCSGPNAMRACVNPPWSLTMLLLTLPLLAAGSLPRQRPPPP
ncbi:hypothetical protein C7E12_11750, partial [Stenotrophomonas maltophilia]